MGQPVVEYNFYAHRAMEGYFEEINLDEMWTNITYFLKAAIVTAEKSNVRLALHANDPPAPVSRGSQQIMGSVAGWKKLTSIVNSPSNGITFDCGVTREMGEDPVEV